MAGLSKFMIAGAAFAALGACATADVDYSGAPTTSISYDPYDFDPDDLLAEAQSFCDAYGLRAVYEDETIDPQSVRWRYRHYRCV